MVLLVAKINRSTIHRISDLCLNAVPMFPSYEPAPTAYSVKKITAGAISPKKAIFLALEILYTINVNIAIQRAFSAAAN